MANFDLILWRHAEAEDSNPNDPNNDLARRLTSKGHRQAQLMAKWINQHYPAPLRILVSPAVRTQETAAALHRPFSTCPEIAPHVSVATLLKASSWPEKKTEEDLAILIVGHQPTLGALVARLLIGRDEDWALKKGALCCLRQRQRFGQAQTVLLAALAPEHLV